MNNPLRMTPETMRLAAHRGHSAGAPENTYASFKLAREICGPGVTCETDLALTRDGEMVLIHDETVDRTTNGKGLVRNMTLQEIERLDAGSWFAPKYAGLRIPKFREAMEFARENDIIYQLEVKVYNRNNEVFPRLKAVIDDMRCADLLQFSAFDFTLLKAIKEYIPGVPTVGLQHSMLIDPVAPARDANLDAVNLEYLNFASGEAPKLHDAGFAVFVHIPRGDAIEKLHSYGWDLRADVVNWIRTGQLDHVISDDAAIVCDIWREAVGK